MTIRLYKPNLFFNDVVFFVALCVRGDLFLT